MSKHAKFSPSSSKRWLNCPASVALSEGIVQETSEAAEEGTLAHSYCERLLRVMIREYSTKSEKTKIIDGILAEIACPDMRHHVQDYVHLVLAIRQKFLNSKKSSKFLEGIEERLTYDDNLYGTADYMIVCGNEAIIIDFKYGERTPVDAKESEQLKTYALCVAASHATVNRVHVVVFQPRSVYGETKTKNSYSREELTTFEVKQVKPAIKTALKILDNGVDEEYLHEGEWCQYCPAVVVCPKKLKMLDNFAEEFPDETLTKKEIIKKADILSIDTLTSIYEKKETLKAMYDACVAVEGILKNRILNGEKIPGYKLVEVSGRRSWNDSVDVKEAKKILKELGVKNPTTEKLIGIGEVEKQLKGVLKIKPDALKNLIRLGVPTPGLAKDSDTRLEWGVNLVEVGFEDVTDQID